MTKIKINKDWEIGPLTAEQANHVWQILKDAGESMLRETPSYSNKDICVMKFLKHNQCWGNTAPKNQTNMTFKEFMKLMKVEDKKEDVQYVDNLLDYLDKPELIQHIDGTHVRAIHHFPDNQGDDQVVVVFEDGATGEYSRNGKYYGTNSTPAFILKPKEKKIVKGWTRVKLSIRMGELIPPTLHTKLKKIL